MRIRYYGEVGRGTGYGRAATDLCAALIRSGVELEIRSLAPPEQVEGAVRAKYLPLPVASALRRDPDLAPNPDVIIVHALPFDCRRALELVGDTKALRVVYTTWETDQAPIALCESLDAFDQVWVPSEATRMAFVVKNFYPLQIYPANSPPSFAYKLRVLPHCFDEETLPSRRGAPTTAPDPRYRFYYIGAWNQRKNPAGIIRAYCHAFTHEDPVELHLQCTGATPESIAEAMGSTGLPYGVAPLVSASVKPQTDEAILELHRRGDCFVSASRGEAWNLPAFDAYLAGRHVIAPALQGSDEFLRDTSAALYDSTLSLAQIDVKLVHQKGGMFSLDTTGAQGLTVKSVWEEPDLIALAAHMKDAYKNQVRNLNGQRAREVEAIARFGYARVADVARFWISQATGTPP